SGDGGRILRCRAAWPTLIARPGEHRRGYTANRPARSPGRRKGPRVNGRGCRTTDPLPASVIADGRSSAATLSCLMDAKQAYVGERRWPMAVAVLIAGGLRVFLPNQLRLDDARPAFIVVLAALIVALIVGDPGRIDRQAT